MGTFCDVSRLPVWFRSRGSFRAVGTWLSARGFGLQSLNQRWRILAKCPPPVCRPGEQALVVALTMLFTSGRAQEFQPVDWLIRGLEGVLGRKRRARDPNGSDAQNGISRGCNAARQSPASVNR